MCRACVVYFGERNPGRFPTIEEDRRAVESYPEPILPQRRGGAAP